MKFEDSLAIDIRSEIEVAKSPEDEDGYNYIVSIIEEAKISKETKERYINIIDNGETYIDGLFALLEEIER